MTLGLTLAVLACASPSSDPTPSSAPPEPSVDQPPRAQPAPPPAQAACGVDLVNNTGDLVDVWYDPGQVRLGVLARNETIEFTVDCGHSVVRIYGKRNNPIAAGQGYGCATAEAWLRPGDSVMVSLNAPKVVPC